MGRVDYQASGKLRISARLAAQIATSKPVPGTIPGFNDNFQKLNSRYAPGATGVYTLNSSTILEATWGMNYINQLNPLFHNDGHEPVQRRAVRLPAALPGRGNRPAGLVGLLHHREDRFAVLRERRGADATRVHVGQPCCERSRRVSSIGTTSTTFARTTWRAA